MHLLGKVVLWDRCCVIMVELSCGPTVVEPVYINTNAHPGDRSGYHWTVVHLQIELSCWS